MSFFISLLNELFDNPTAAPEISKQKPVLSSGTPTLFSTAINASRISNALPPLTPDPSLDRAASWWAGEMARNSVLTHGDAASRIASVLHNSASGECIGMGYPSADAVVIAWMADLAHRAIVLGDYDRVGVGEMIDSGGQAWWCADFAKVG